MKTLITVPLCFFLHTLCYAQTDRAWSKTDKEVKNKIQELRGNKIDTIVCYYVNCIGAEVHVLSSDTSCTAYDIKYLLWAEQGKYFMQRFDECSDHLSIPIEPSFFHFLKKNFIKIKKLKIHYPEYDVIEKHKKKTYFTFVDHSCHTIFEIHVGEKLVKQDIDDFALETKYVEGKYLNKNFYPNKKSVLNELKFIAEQAVNSYNKRTK